MRKNSLISMVSAVVLLVVFLFLILYPNVAVSGVKEGGKVAGMLLPSLFPFFVCGELFVRLGLCARISARFGRVFTRFLRLPAAAAGALILGLIGGYPAGAQAVGQLYARGEIEREEAERALAVCNQAGPSFFFGVLGGAVFQRAAIGAFLFGAQTAAMVILCRVTGQKETAVPLLPRDNQAVTEQSDFGTAFSTAVVHAGESALRVCMFVVVFCVAEQYLLFACAGVPTGLRPLILGILELSGGCAALGQSGLPVLWQMVCAAGLTAFGGVCVWAQSRAAVQEYGLTGRLLLPYKAVQAVLCAAITLLAALALAGKGLCVPVSATVGASVSLAALLAPTIGAGIAVICLKLYHSFLRQARV